MHLMEVALCMHWFNSSSVCTGSGFMCMCVHAQAHVCVHAQAHVCVHAQAHVCVHVHVCVCVCVCVCVRV